MPQRPTPPFRILIVEDEALLAMDIEAMVEDLGHLIVGESASLDEVRALPDDLRPDLAFVDVQLAHGSSGLDACRVIRDRWQATEVVFVTANLTKIPPDFCGGLGVIPKPFSRSGLVSAMKYLTEGISDPPPVSSQPQSFLAAPETMRIWTSPPAE